MLIVLQNEQMFEMAQRQSQVDDLRSQRLQTDLASSQNRSVMIFTTFTVIFLPLSFFTSLFGMNTLEWGGPNAQYPSLGFIGEISLPLSLIMIVATLFAAFNTSVQIFFKALIRQVVKSCSKSFSWVMTLGRPGAHREAARLTKERRATEAWQQMRNRRRAADFWAEVRRFEPEVEIPDGNRKTNLSS